VNPRYFSSWSSYRTLRRVVFLLFFAAIVQLRWLAALPVILFPIGFFAYFLSALWLANWRCPRCGQPFFRGAFLRSLFGGRCFHCALPKWAVSRSGDIQYRPRFPVGWTSRIQPE
jgi:hypothetical protein